MGQMTVLPQLSFSEAFNAATSKIFQFTGRSRRSEFWWMMLLVYALSIFLTPFIGFFLYLATIPLTFRRLHDIGKSGWWYGCCVILKVAFFVFLMYDIIMMAINEDNMRGYEDQFFLTIAMKYGIWLLIIFVYQIVLLVFFCMDSQVEENEYGVSPKYQTVEDAQNE